MLAKLIRVRNITDEVGGEIRMGGVGEGVRVGRG